MNDWQEDQNKVKFEWEDVTMQFREAASSLALGELFRDKDFTLLEAMSAIEMMDPKMDAGMLCNKAKSCSLEEAIMSGRLKVSDLTVYELRSVLDTSLRCFVSWLEGNSLAQTLFTNLYLHNVELVDDRTMRALSIITLKIVRIIVNIMFRIGVYEEEDFYGVTYNFDLGTGLTDPKASALLKECEEDMHKRAKRIKQQPPDEDVVIDDDKDYDELMRLYQRIRFVRLLFQGLNILELKVNVTEARKALQGALEIVRTIEQGDLDDDDEFPNVMGFEASVNQRLLPSTFPRYTKIASCRTTFKILEETIERILEVIEVVHLDSYNQVLDFFADFSKKSPCVLSRCIGRLVYMPSPGMVFGVTKTTDVLKDAVRTFCRPPVYVAKTTLSQMPECRDWADGLLLRCVQPLFGLLQVTGHNRARQREKCTRVLEGLSTVQAEAERVDSLMLLAQKDVEPTAPGFQWFTMWLMTHVLKTQISYLLMGFELELYSVHEYCYIFWYLYEYLYRFLVTALSQAENYMMECDKRLKKQKKDNRCTKTKRSIKSYHQKELFITQVMQFMCGGYYKTMLALRMDERLPTQSAEFDSEKTRYEHRFLPFHSVLTPPVVSYQQYCDINDLSKYGKLTPQGMYDAASRCFSQAKLLLEQATDLSDEQSTLLRISKNNMIVVNLLQMGHRREATVTFENEHHLYFPLIKLR